jgi:glycosyltransferase involved in cell wall biosynthesis
MRIVINTKLSKQHHYKYHVPVIKNMIENLLLINTHHTILILLDDALTEFNLTTDNIIQQKIKQSATNNLSIKYWYDVTLAFIIKKFKADIVLHVDSKCSLTIKTPQIILFHQTLFIQQPNFFNKTDKLFYQLLQKKHIQKAKAIITFSEHSKQSLQQAYSTTINKINTIQLGLNKLDKIITQKDKETTLQQYANGIAYFLFIGTTYTANNIVTLLKAFSIFKKRLQSSMKLILLIEPSRNDQAIKEKLTTYKHREDVVWLQNLTTEQEILITSAAYAIIQPASLEIYTTNLLNAMQLSIPIACSNESFFTEYLSDAALYFNNTNENNIAEQMMLLYKDENLRNQHIEKGKQQTTPFTWHNNATMLWNLIEQYAKK